MLVIGISKYKMKSHSLEKSKGRSTKGNNKKGNKAIAKTIVDKKIPEFLKDTFSNSLDLSIYRKKIVHK